MKIAVLLKQVPDTASKIKPRPNGSGIEEADIKFVMNPYDEFAVEEALRTKQAIPAAETVVISLGPQRAVEGLRTALAMGMDRAIHIDSEGHFFDSWSTAKILSAVVRERGFDLILCGKQAIDADNSQVPGMMAEFLGIPQVMIIEKMELKADHKGAIVTRRIGGGAKEIYDVDFPAVLGCEKGLNIPRYASLPGIMKAKTKPLEALKTSSLLGGATAQVEYVNYRMPPERKEGKVIAGEPAEQAAQLVKLLREEAKVI